MLKEVPTTHHLLWEGRERQNREAQESHGPVKAGQEVSHENDQKAGAPVL